MFPNDITLRPLAERDHNVVHWAEFTRGGHFAAPAGAGRVTARPSRTAGLVVHATAGAAPGRTFSPGGLRRRSDTGGWSS